MLNVKRAVLRTLSRTSSYALPEATLIDEVQLSVPNATASEIRQAISELDQSKAISAGRGPLDDQARWLITATGQAMLAG